MNSDAIEEAARLFIEARRTGQLLDGLPAHCRPATLDDAHAIQDATVAGLGESVAGWKVGSPLDGRVVRGVLLQSRIFASGDALPAAQMPLLGVEAEIAFRFDRDRPPRTQEYEYADVAGAVSAMVAIEVVATRFRSYRDAPLIERIADCVSNGGFVVGTVQARWRDVDLSQLQVTLAFDGNTIVQRAGGHPTLTTDSVSFSSCPTTEGSRARTGVKDGSIPTASKYFG